MAPEVEVISQVLLILIANRFKSWLSSITRYSYPGSSLPSGEFPTCPGVPCLGPRFLVQAPRAPGSHEWLQPPHPSTLFFYDCTNESKRAYFCQCSPTFRPLSNPYKTIHWGNILIYWYGPTFKNPSPFHTLQNKKLKCI